MSAKYKTSTKDIISDPLTFFAKRFPNFQEAITISASQASVDIFLGRLKSIFGDNPTASAVFRDASKFPSIYLNVVGNNTLGYTGVKYDEGSLYASGVKLACKAIGLTSYYAVLGNSDFPSAARASNYLCEIPSRFFHIVSREKQKVDSVSLNVTNKEYLTFIAEDTNPSWIREAIGESFIKTLTSDQLGEVAKSIKYTPYIKNTACFIDNAIALSLGADLKIMPFTPDDDIYSKAWKTFAMFGLTIQTPVALVAVTAVDWVAKFTNEMINAYGLGTPTRALQDFSGVAIREGGEKLEEFNSQEYYNNFLDFVGLNAQNEL